MRRDELYSKIKLPDYIEALLATPELQRLKDISQGDSPKAVCSWNVPNRFDHAIGVAHLMSLVLEQNPSLHDQATLLMVSALLHDVGNPCFSHLAEPFLFEICAKDGESFLPSMLAGTAAEKIVCDLGLSVAQITEMITGETELSRILNGSLDVDNIDNVPRYYNACEFSEISLDGEELARSFRWKGSQWQLLPSAAPLVEQWMFMRTAVYEETEHEPKLAAFQMIRRALYFPFRDGLLSEQFFKFNDQQAFDCLKATHSDSRAILEVLNRGERYLRTKTYHDWPGAEEHTCCEGNLLYNQTIATDIADELGLPESSVIVAIARLNARRKITLTCTDPSIVLGLQAPSTSHYRATAYVAPEFSDQISRVEPLLELHLRLDEVPEQANKK